ncbi:MAG: Uma2 family endonuclease, partial [Gammaproteobacteria bacterium]
MSHPAERMATYEDLLQVPDNLVAEIIGGRLVESPRLAPRNALAYSALGSELVGPFQKGRGGPGDWWILDGPEVHLGQDILVPDLAGWRRERLPVMPDTAFFDLNPDWVCEILSPSTAQSDRVEKMPIYAREGVAHIWLVDPELRTLEVFALSDEQWVLHGAYRDA